MPSKIAILIGIAFIGVALFGVSVSMPMDKNGAMPDCPFASGSGSICPMNVVQHIGYWQQLFTSTIPASTALTPLLLFMITAYGIFSRILINEISQKSQSAYFSRESNTRFKLFNHLLLLLSGGILNPKIYNLLSISR